MATRSVGSSGTPATTTGATAPSRGSTTRVPWRAVGKIAGLCAPVALLANLMLYVLANAAGWFEPVTRPHGRPITEVEVIVATLVAVVTAIGAYVALARLTRHPARNFTFLAAAVLVVSIFPPATLRNAPGELVAVLIAMHLVTAGLCVAAVWLFGRPELIREREKAGTNA